MSDELDTRPRPAGTAAGGRGQGTASGRATVDVRPVAPGSSGEARHFETLEPLGEGAMGTVHLARDPVLRRKVALKSLRPAMRRHPPLLARFLAEMQITAQLDHPHIVPVYGVEESPDGALSYAMKVVQGRELEHLIEETKERVAKGLPLEGGTSLQARLEVFTKVCDAIAYAHDRGIIHRDLKPSNVMIGAFNEVYVLDWGVARLIGPEGAELEKGAEVYEQADSPKRHAIRTTVGDFVGTPLYMSPEQAAGDNDKLDGRSDLYALGLILQELVTFELAVPGDSMPVVFANARAGRRNPVVSSVAGVVIPKEIVAIVEKATRLHPADRYASVAEMAEDIRRFLRGEAVSAKPDDISQRVGRWIGKHRMATAGALLFVALAGAGGTVGVWLSERFELAERENRALRQTELQATSALRVQTLDDSLKRFERELARLAGAAAIALSTTGPGAPPAPPERFVLGEGAPPGLVASTFYGRPVSFSLFSSTVAAGTDPALAEEQLGALQSLQGTVVRAMIDALPVATRALPLDQALASLADPGGPIVRLTIVTNEGVRAALPGMAEAGAPKDGREDALYQRARSTEGVVWGTSAPGPAGVPTLPCAMSIHGATGQILGVLRLDIDPTKAVEAALDEAALEHVQATLVVDRSGKVLSQKRGPDVAAEPDVLAMAPVREAIERGESGVLQTRRDGRDVLVTYQPLASVDWYLVTVADVDGLAKAKPPAAARPGGVSVQAKKGASTAAPAATAPVAAAAPPTASAEAAPTASASASASASAAPSASAPPASPPAGGRPLGPPANPFDPWKAYEKGPPRKRAP